MTSTGAVNSFHSSYTPFGGGMVTFDMLLGEISPGGVGSGLYGMLVIAILTVFIAGLMVGRTPEYLGKKIGPREMKLVSLYILTVPLLVLFGTGLAMALPEARDSILNGGPHGSYRGALCLHVGGEQQRKRLRRAQCQHHLLQHRTGYHHGARPPHPDRAGSGSCRIFGSATPCTGDRRNAPGPWSAVRCTRRRSRAHRRRADLLPCSGARTASRRASIVSTTTATSDAGRALFHPAQLVKSLPDAVRKLSPRQMVRNPVMFVVLVGAAGSTLVALDDPTVFAWMVTAWLWLTVIFANLAEALAEGRGRAQAATLRKARTDTTARRLVDGGGSELVPATELTVGDRVLVEAGEVIPGDGDVIDGVASVDESAITGESAPVIRESGGDRSAVTGGTRVLSDHIVVADHVQAWRDVHRPHDRVGRRCFPTEDT